MKNLCLMSLVLLVGCEPVPPESCVEPEAGWIDQDYDSYIQRDDCRDRNPAFHPLAFDICDGKDNDCDGEVDEGYPDVDGDGVPDCTTTERCNGSDDDGDGRIDEGFPDFDGDDVADCLDDLCDVTVDAARDIEVDEECSDPVIIVTDPWNVRKEWEYVSGAGSYTAPKVGRLEDTNGDGRVDVTDDPRVIIMNWGGSWGGSGEIIALDGPTGRVEWRYSGANQNAGTAMADIDSDGEVEIVTFDTSRRAIAIGPTGSLEWTSSTAATNEAYPMLTVADLDMDGDPEVITATHVLDGSTGAVEATLPTRSGIPYTSPTIGDIDLDGEQEILNGDMVLDASGAVEWRTSVRGSYGHWNAIVNTDGDPEAEVVSIGGGRVGVYEHDGTVIREISTTDASRPGPICVADFDGDGVVELAWPSNNVLAVYELDTTKVWTASVNDSSGLAGCAGFDVNGDGAYEILFADQTKFWMLDGKTGSVLYDTTDHSSGTVFEYPIVADVDNDFSAEILYMGQAWGATTAGVKVLGHGGSGWPESGATWPVHDFAVTNVLPDGSIPRVPDNPWQVHNTFRARPAVDDVAINLTAEIIDVCVSSCDVSIGVASVSVEVGNEGGLDVNGDVALTLYSVDEAGTDVALETVYVPGVPGGTAVASVVFDVPVGDLGPDGFRVAVDDDGTGASQRTECDEDDNTDTWPYKVCPHQGP